MRGHVENKNNPVNTRFVDKTSDIRNLSENITSDAMLIYQKWQQWYQWFLEENYIFSKTHVVKSILSLSQCQNENEMNATKWKNTKINWSTTGGAPSQIWPFPRVKPCFAFLIDPFIINVVSNSYPGRQPFVTNLCAVETKTDWL